MKEFYTQGVGENQELNEANERIVKVYKDTDEITLSELEDGEIVATTNDVISPEEISNNIYNNLVEKLEKDFSRMPIGSIVSFAGETPTGWLPCDGSEFDVEKYSALAAYLNSDHVPFEPILDKTPDWNKSWVGINQGFVAEHYGWVTFNSTSSSGRLTVNGVAQVINGYGPIVIPCKPGDTFTWSNLQASHFTNAETVRYKAIKAFNGITEAESPAVEEAIQNALGRMENKADKLAVELDNKFNSVPIGTLLDYEGATPPTGFLFADGSEFDSDEYPLLYAFLGTNVLPNKFSHDELGPKVDYSINNTNLPTEWSETFDKDTIWYITLWKTATAAADIGFFINDQAINYSSPGYQVDDRIEIFVPAGSTFKITHTGTVGGSLRYKQFVNHKIIKAVSGLQVPTQDQQYAELTNLLMSQLKLFNPTSYENILGPGQIVSGTIENWTQRFTVDYDRLYNISFHCRSDGRAIGLRLYKAGESTYSWLAYSNCPGVSTGKGYDWQGLLHKGDVVELWVDKCDAPNGVVTAGVYEE